jgi:hypothetical protein
MISILEYLRLEGAVLAEARALTKAKFAAEFFPLCIRVSSPDAYNAPNP